MTSESSAIQRCMALFGRLLDNFGNLTKRLQASTPAAVSYCEDATVWQFTVIVSLSPWPVQEHEMGGYFFALDNAVAFSVGLY